MLSRFLLIAVIVFSSVLESRAWIFDFVGAVDSSQVSRIDSILMDYEKRTGIKLTITTITAEKYDKAEVEQAERNEILLFIIPSKKVCIANVGDGLKRWVTNRYVSIILTQNMKVAFSTNLYGKGIENIISELKGKLGYLTLYQRETILMTDAMRSDLRRQTFISAIMWLMVILALSLIIYFPIRRKRMLSQIESKKEESVKKQNVKQPTQEKADGTSRELVEEGY